MKSYLINFQPLSQRGQCPPDHTLLDLARDVGADLVGICGGHGTCGRCKVQIISGRVSEPTANEREALSAEEFEEGYRLACQTCPESDLTINIPAESLSAPQRLQLDGLEIMISPDPAVRTYGVTLAAPSLSDLKGDDDRLFDGLKSSHCVTCRLIDREALRGLSPGLRSFGWAADVSVRGDEVIAVAHQGKRRLGMAVDLGTTKIAGYLVDLESGSTLSAKGRMNPQIAYGEDVITRITMASESSTEAERLQHIVVDELNDLIGELCGDVDAGKEEIMEMVIVGNTAMHHLLLRLPVDQLGRAPHIATARRAIDVKARDLGIIVSEGAYIHLMSNIAGFVGGDHVAMLLAIDAWKADGPLLAIDIGTNTEISLAVNGELSSVSCASGPAFEGYHIKYGMRAAAGAIEHIKIKGGDIEYHTINGSEPVGICGSGIFDAMAQLYLNGIIDKSGRMGEDHPRVRSKGNHREFVLVSEKKSGSNQAITITQNDIRELQLAKAAIRTGIDILLMKSGLSDTDISSVIIAGAFGNFIDIPSAITIGMFPKLPLDRFRQVGNAAGTGARTALISMVKREEAKTMADRVRYIELAGAPEFNKTFMRAINME